jgi:hypothetical protein
MRIEVNKDDKKISIVFYDSIESLPIKRYQLIQKYSLIDAGIGSDMGDIVNKFAKFDHFIQQKDFDSLLTERENLLMNILFMFDGKGTATYLLASMIKSIDNVDVDVSDDTIDELVSLLECSDITYGQVEAITTSQKKSLIGN